MAMEQRIQLKHPQGKNAVSMSREKYNLLKPLILRHLRKAKSAVFNDIVDAIRTDFKTNGTKFTGSLSWHLEWVKLDLEARKMIRRVPHTAPQEYIVPR
jgi:hypothetical protein